MNKVASSGVRRWLALVAIAVLLSAITVLVLGGWDYLSWRFGERVSIADRLTQFAPRADSVMGFAKQRR